MSKANYSPYIHVSFPRWMWKRIYPIAQFIEEQGEDIDIDYKVWIKGTPEPEIPGIPEAER